MKRLSGVAFPLDLPDLICQLWLFKYGPRLAQDPLWRPDGYTIEKAESPYTGTGRHEHSVLITQMWRPGFQWNPWAMEADQAFGENARTALCGGGSSSKSWTAGEYALKFAFSSPRDTAVVIISTTIDAAKRRIWKSIASGYGEITKQILRLGVNLGETQLVSSPKPQIRTSGDKGDFVHGIYVVAVKQGTEEQAINDIKGYHAKRMLVVRDETDAISQATIDVEANLRIGTDEFQSIDIGNLPSSLNPLGKQMETFPGKPITEALGYEWVSHKGVKCLRFDGEQSPNIRENGKYKGLMTEADRADIERQAGGRNTPMYWIMVKGLPPPEGVEDTVCSEAMLHKFHCFDKVTWASSYITSAMLDPGFGGDPCILRFMKRGNDKDGRFRVLLTDIIPIPILIDPTGQSPAEYQIARRVMDECKARGVPPDEFIGDTTGIGRGTGSVLQREWSPRIHLCEFGGAPSDMIVSEEDPRPAKDVYDRQVTELWFSIREFIEADLIRGLDETTALQLCQRKYEVKGRRKSIQKKDELPKSPNEADALACGIKLLRTKGIQARVQSPVKQEAQVNLNREAAEQDFDSHEDTYSDEYEFV